MYITSSYSYGSADRLDRHLQPHFLDSCFLCRKPIGSNSDIFMYRGNTPFCSKECRQEQIEIDESSEMSMNTPWKKRLPSSSSSSSSSGARSAVRKSQPKDSSSSPSTANKAAVRTGTVAVA